MSKLTSNSIEQIRTAILRHQRSEWPGYGISVAVGTKSECGQVQVLITRWRDIDTAK